MKKYMRTWTALLIALTMLLNPLASAYADNLAGEEGVVSGSSELIEETGTDTQETISADDTIQAGTEQSEEETQPETAADEAAESIPQEVTETVTAETTADEDDNLAEYVLEDAAYGVTLTVPRTSLPEGTLGKNLRMQVRDLTAEEKADYLDTVGVQESKILWVYDITLIDAATNLEVQPSGAVQLSVATETNAPEAASVIRLEHEGGYTTLDSTMENDELTFETEHFSIYGGVMAGMAIFGYLDYTYASNKYIIAYKEEDTYLNVAFCIQENITMSVDENGEATSYTIYHNLSEGEFSENAQLGSGVTISPEDFMRLKRMMYLYYTTYENNTEDFAINDYYAGYPKNNGYITMYYWNSADQSRVGSKEDYIYAKNWILFQILIHNFLRYGFGTEAGNGFYDWVYKADYTGINPNTTSKYKLAYYAAALDSSKDVEINEKFDFLIGVNEKNQNVIFIKEKNGSIDTTVRAKNLYSTDDAALPVSTGDKNEKTITIPVTDIVTYKDVKTGSPYTATAELYEVSNGKIVGEAVNTVQRIISFSSTEGTYEMDFGDLTLNAGKSYVVYETLTSNSNVLDTDGDGTADAIQSLEHKDASDNSQTFGVASAGTTVKAGDTSAASGAAVSVSDEDAENGVLVVDTINYKNLPVGQSYTVTATIYEVTLDESTGKYSITGNSIATKTQTATIDSANGTIGVDFGTVKLSSGKTYVVYETMASVNDLIDSDGDGTADTKHILKHEDPDDKEQMMVVKQPGPKINVCKRIYGAEVETTLPGATLAVFDLDGNKVIDDWVTQTECCTSSIDPGEYILREIEAPDGYTKVPDIQFKVDDEGNITIVSVGGETYSEEIHNIVKITENASGETVAVIYDKPTTSFSVVKTWADGVTPEEVTVQLYLDGQKAEIEGVTTEVKLNADNNWYYEWTNLPDSGTYTAKEVVASDAVYEPVYKGVQEVEIPGDETTETVTKWVKVDLSTEGISAGDEIVLIVASEGTSNTITASGVIGKALSNSGTSLTWNSDVSVVATDTAELLGVTDSVIWKVTSNSTAYKLTNKSSGYWISKESNYFFSATKSSISGGNDKLTITSDGQVKAGGIYPLMYNSNNGNFSTGYNISSNITFDVYKQKEVTVTTGTASKTVEAYQIHNVPQGSIPKGEIELTKIDKTSSTKLSGAEFALWREDSSQGGTIPNTDVKGEWISTQITGEDGVISFTDLIYGTYYIIETNAPDGYELSSTPIIVTVGSSGVALADTNTADNASSSNSTIHTISGSYGTVDDMSGLWSLCINGHRYRPNSTNGTGQYVIHNNVGYEEMKKYIDIVSQHPDSGMASTVEMTSFSQDQYNGMLRVLYWYLTIGNKYNTSSIKYGLEEAQLVMRKFTDDYSRITDTYYDSTSLHYPAYISCYNFVILGKDENGNDILSDEEIAAKMNVHVYVDTDTTNTKTLQNMVTATLVGDDSLIEVGGDLTVTNEKIDTPSYELPITGGSGVGRIFMLSMTMLALAAALFAGMKRYRGVRR